jgi:hypothetical protein
MVCVSADTLKNHTQIASQKHRRICRLNLPDKFIDTLKHYIFSDQSDKEHQNRQPTDHWYTNLDIKMEMRQKIKTFASLAFQY